MFFCTVQCSIIIQYKPTQCNFLSRRSHVTDLRHVKEPKSDVEVATFGKILGNFSPIVPPSAAGVRSRLFRHEGHLVAGVGTF